MNSIMKAAKMNAEIYDVVRGAVKSWHAQCHENTDAILAARAGISREMVVRFRNGTETSNLSLDTLCKLSSVLGIRIEANQDAVRCNNTLDMFEKKESEDEV